MALLGTYVGIIPVMLGLLWLPFFRAVGWRWFRFLMAVTIGLLLFLVVEAMLEGIETAQDSAPAFGGALLVFAGALFAYLLLKAADTRLRPEKTKGAFTGANVALLVSIGIGLHNLSEGLGIGAAYAIGSVAFGTFLVIGFTIQNVTEGLAIVAPMARAKPQIRRLLAPRAAGRRAGDRGRVDRVDRVQRERGGVPLRCRRRRRHPGRRGDLARDARLGRPRRQLPLARGDRGRLRDPLRDEPVHMMPASRKARDSLSISRAITIRWISFVPS